MYILLSIIIISLWLETSLTTLPLFLIILSILLILFKQIWIVGIAFIGGIILDIAAMRPVGGTSIFLILWLLLILLYERKYEINSYPFIFVSSLIGTVVYLFIFNNHEIVSQAILNSVAALLIFAILKINKNKLIL